MTGNINNNATGILVLILPLAITLVLFIKAWPFILALMVLIVIYKIWQSYQWRKWNQKVNPFFTQLIKENQGCITPLDLSLKANLTAKAAHRFLEGKAEEYGAQKKVYAEKGVVYYFLTASALGSIFEQSDQSELEEQENSETSPQVSTSTDKFPQISTKEIAEIGKQPSNSMVTETQTVAVCAPEIVTTENHPLSSPSENSEISPPVTVESIEVSLNDTSPPTEVKETSEETEVEETLGETSEETEVEETVSEEEEITEAENSSLDSESNSSSNLPKLELIQADLAKRLDINPSTVGRRKTDPDFPLWSQTKDPEGIAWKYNRKTKMFISVDLDS